MTSSSSRVEGDRRQLGTIGKNNFDFCRFWLSMLVVFSHSFALADGNEDHEPMGILTTFQIGSGSFSVNCFFAISGFLITHSWLRSKSPIDFLIKRVLRIYPGFIAAVFFDFFLVGPIASERFEVTTRRLFALLVNLIPLRNTQPAGAFASNPFPDVVNGSLWTIPYEFKCYLGLMLLGGLGLLSSRKWLNISLLIGVVIGSAIYPLMDVPSLEKGTFATIIGTASRWFQVLPYFLAGTTFYLFRDRIPFSSRGVVSTIIALALAALFPPAGRLVFPFLITYLLFWFSFHPSVHFQKWACYGDFSYGIYLYSFPIQQLIVMKIPGISPIILFVMAAPLSVIAGVISWHLIEKYFLRMKHRLPSQAALKPLSC